MTWRSYSDWAKRKPIMLRLADRLGRGRGRARLLDRVNPAPPAPHRPKFDGWNRHELAAVWIGHATVLLRAGGMNILTDPVMSDRVGLGLGVMTGGPRRFVAPATHIRQLPQLDLILVSHAHFDHLDRPTLVRMPKHVPVIAAPNTRDLIDDLGFTSVSELRWGESLRVGKLCVTARRVQHWGARTFYDQHRGFNAYLLESGRRRVLYGGDTGFHEHFRDIGKVDVAILGIGGYDPYIHAHASPEQAWQMADHVRADVMIPMHHSTFRLSYEPMHEPMDRLLEAAGRSEQRVVIRKIGGAWFG